MDNFQKDTNSRLSDSAAFPGEAPGGENEVSGYNCPECGEEIRPSQKYCTNCRYYLADHFPETPEEMQVRLHASLKDKIFKQDAVGILPLKVHNSTGERVQKIEVNIECPFIDEKELKPAVRKELADGKSAEFNLNILPKKQGELVARIFITYWKTDAEPNVLEGETILYTVSDTQSRPAINIDGSVHANGAEVYGMDAARNININIDNSKNPGSQVLPEYFSEKEYRELPLKWSLESTKLLRDHLSSKPEAREITPAEQTRQAPARGAWLRWEMPGQNSKMAYLHFEPVIRLGREADQDIICFHMTEQNEVDEKSFCVSRRHLSLQVESNACRIEDHSSHGTDIDSYRLHQNSVYIGDGQIINLAGFFPLKYREYKDLSKFRNRVQQALNASHSIGQSAFRFSAYKEDMGRLPLNAVRLQKIGRTKGTEYFILLKELDMGNAENAPMVLPCEDVAELHAKLVLYNGRLRIVDLGSEAGTRVNGEKLPPHGSKTLESDDHLQLGSAAGTIRYVPKRNGGAG